MTVPHSHLEATTQDPTHETEHEQIPGAADGELVRTYVAAATLTGVVPATVQGWVRRGRLTPPPWTPDQLLAASATPRHVAPRRGQITAEHGTESRYHAGCRCRACKSAHTEQTTTWKRAQRARWWSERQWELCRLLASGRSLAEASAEVGATPAGVAAFRRADPDFGRRVDEALTAGRDRTLEHGTHSAWAAGCRCPQCRETHDASRGPGVKSSRKRVAAPVFSERP